MPHFKTWDDVWYYECSVTPDPLNFVTFNGTEYSLNVAGDLVLVHHYVDDRNAIDIHIRGAPARSGYSDVKRVAIKIGNNDTFEVDTSGPNVEYIVVGGASTSPPSMYANYPFLPVEDGHELALPDGEYVRILEYGEKSLQLIVSGSTSFDHSVGLCGRGEREVSGTGQERKSPQARWELNGKWAWKPVTLFCFRNRRFLLHNLPSTTFQHSFKVIL